MNIRQLDVWAVNKEPLEILTALKQFSDNKKKITKPLKLFCNCTSSLVIDGVQTKRHMDTLIYSEEIDTVLCLSGSHYYDENYDFEATPEIIAKYLDIYDIPYEIISGEPQEGISEDANIPETWYAREGYVLKDSLDDSRNKGCSDCRIYKNSTGDLSIGYTKDGVYHEIWGLNFSGIVETDTSWTLLINEQDERNISIEEAKKIITEKGFTYTEIDTPIINEESNIKPHM